VAAAVRPHLQTARGEITAPESSVPSSSRGSRTRRNACGADWNKANPNFIYENADKYASGVDGSMTTTLTDRLTVNQSNDDAFCTRGKAAVQTMKNDVSAHQSTSSLGALERNACMVACIAGKLFTYASGFIMPPTDIYLSGSGAFYRDQTPASALLTGKGNCVGFSSFTTSMLKSIGVNARVVAGDAGFGPHAWVEVTDGLGESSLSSLKIFPTAKPTAAFGGLTPRSRLSMT